MIEKTQKNEPVLVVTTGGQNREHRQKGRIVFAPLEGHLDFDPDIMDNCGYTILDQREILNEFYLSKYRDYGVFKSAKIDGSGEILEAYPDNIKCALTGNLKGQLSRFHLKNIIYSTSKGRDTLIDINCLNEEFLEELASESSLSGIAVEIKGKPSRGVIATNFGFSLLLELFSKLYGKRLTPHQRTFVFELVKTIRFDKSFVLSNRLEKFLNAILDKMYNGMEYDLPANNIFNKIKEVMAELANKK